MLQWTAKLGNRVYGTHRWEHRSFLHARRRYLDEKGITLEDAEFEMVIEWPTKMEKAEALVARYQREVNKAEAALKAATAARNQVLGMFIAGWKDCGMSQKQASELADVVVATGTKYVAMTGSDDEAAAELWKRINVTPGGVLGRKSTRTNPTTVSRKIKVKRKSR